MAELNPLTVIAEHLAKASATTDKEEIGRYLADALAALQTDMTEDDAIQMLENAIVSGGTDDAAHNADLFQVWLELQPGEKNPKREPVF